jgi:fatty-acyl-CoA synthase
MVAKPTFADLLLARAADEHPALRSAGATLSYRDLVDGARRRAALAGERRRPGPFHLAVLLDGGPEYVLWLAAAAVCGAAVVGVNPTRRGAHILADVRKSDAQLLISQAGLRGLLPVDAVPDCVLVDSAEYSALLAAATPAEPAPIGAGDPLLLLFTSGTTGEPKIVVCSQGRLAAIASRSADLFAIDRDDVLYNAMPLFHGNAIMANLAPAVARGATIALRPRFSASQFLSDVRCHGATYFNYVGRALAYILATPEQPDDADNPLRLGFGTEASARDRAEFERRFDCRIVESYGSSEGVVTLHRTAQTPAGALGCPVDGNADVAVVDADGRECAPARFDDHGRILNAGESIGEIVARAGAGSFEGYYRDPAATAARLRAGWYWTGDLAFRDSQGWFYFAGRGGDRLRVDSENFAAAPIEDVLARYPAAVMVAVYPVPDPRTGDEVMAALELRPGASFDPLEFAAFLAGQPDLGTKWAPRFVRLVPNMPLTGTNKVRKPPLRLAGWWDTTDPVWWRAGRDTSYRRLTDEDRFALRARFDAHGRARLLGAAPAAESD